MDPLALSPASNSCSNKRAKQLRGLGATVQGKAKVGRGLPYLVVPGFLFKNVQVLFQSSLRLASLQVLFRFFQSAIQCYN